MEIVSNWVLQHGYLGLSTLLALGILGIPVPDEVLLSFTGYLVFQGKLRLMPALASAFLGSMCGITLSYGLGYTLGSVLVKRYGRILRLTEEKMIRVQNWFKHIGRWSLFIGYFFPGIRHLTAFAAGSSKLRLSSFAPFAYSGALVWSASFIMLGYLLGHEWAAWSEKIRHNLLIGSAVIVALSLLYLIFQQRRQSRKKSFTT